MRKIDFTESTFGQLTAVRPGAGKLIGKKTKRLRSTWICVCDCGNEVEVLASNLRRKNGTTSCGCKVSSNGLTSGNNVSCGDKMHRESLRIGEIPVSHMQAVKNNAIKRGRQFSLTGEYLWGLFLEQQGKCSLSGVELEFTKGRNASTGRKFTTASLDRIDNSQGYIMGNVRWVHKRVNIMRGDLNDQDFVSWCLRCTFHHRRMRDARLSRTRKWDYRFLDLAMDVSEFSKDPSTKVGAVIVDSENRVVSFGYNGLPRGVEDSEDRLHNREVKLKMVQHAEKNAISFAEREKLRGGTIYIFPFMPCAQCAGQIIQVGTSRVVAPVNDNPRWQEEFYFAKQLFNEAGVVLDILEYPEV